MRVQRGDVVLVDYPYSDRTGSKVRPCVVVQSDANNSRLDDTIVVMISSRTRYAERAPTQVLIEADSAAGKAMGLLFDSAVLCENIVTIDGDFAKRKIGVIPPELMPAVNRCLQEALGL